MVLNASYVCLHAFSLRRESPDLDPGRWTLHFYGGSLRFDYHHACDIVGSDDFNFISSPLHDALVK
jgi:hypothetical protein